MCVQVGEDVAEAPVDFTVHVSCVFNETEGTALQVAVPRSAIKGG